MSEETAEAVGKMLEIPRVALVVLVGASGSGKSTFAARCFAPTQVLSSDHYRGVVADDENDQTASTDAFEALHHVVGIRLRRGLLTVVDATNVQEHARASLVKLAREHDVLPVAVVLDVPAAECVRRNESRPDRDFGAHVVTRHAAALRRSLPRLQREGFRIVHVLRGAGEVAAAHVRFTRMLNDHRELTGPFDVVGDVHGCRGELETLLTTLGYALRRDDEGRAVGATPPAGRTAVFVGDLVDRGPDTPGVLRLVMGMVAAGEALCVPGNHENKLIRALRGRNVKVSHGLAESLEQLGRETPEFRAEAEAFMDGLVSHLVLDEGRLVVSHAGLKEAYHGRASGRVRSFALYGDTTGETDEYGLPVRYPWAQEYRGRAMVLYGHTPTATPEWVNNTLCLDTGCVFGGALTALRYPEREIVSVPAEREWYAPVRPLAADQEALAGGFALPSPASHGQGAGPRHGDGLELTDVLPDGPVRVLETAHHGRVSVRAENAAAALEVMSRFAIDPRPLLYLPPTMAPCATSTLPDVLEHPAEAFAAYADDGVVDVVCEEKHMGSRAVVLLCRTPEVARRRFGLGGVPDDGTDGGTDGALNGAAAGAVWTRTGRAFLDDALTAALVDRLRAAADAAGLWTAAGAGDDAADWVLLDCEVMPWSAKAVELLRRQYAAVGAAGRAALPAARDVLGSVAARGIDVGDLLARTQARRTDVDAFTAAYRRYCWPTDGLSGLRVAPFQVLAAGLADETAAPPARAFHTRDHLWHLGIADALVAADPGLVAPTRRLVVRTDDATSVAAGVAWWEELTGAGGEGMVVKPVANLVRGPKGIVQPGVKVRGREYLRIIYGPEYTEPANLDRLRRRSLGHKRSLALREYALGLEALERTARGEPLWRVHECVFAVLACESEPVDPRL
ncbi:MAG: polynucleotide kinase-phosphatase [Actinobacteria bacterium]|nr:polynucleotide kinase-phosphatase [Actinomycetota bacterium]